MMRHTRLVVWVLILLAAAIAAALLWRRGLSPQPPLEVSFWYWHQPFYLSAAEVAELKALGVRELFVRAGTFHKAGNSVALALPQQWEHKEQGEAGAAATDELFDVHLVLNFDYDVVRNFADLSNKAIAGAVLAAARHERQRAERAGAKVIGLQLDFDCPTRLLIKYAKLLGEVHVSRFSEGLSLSITALPTWFTSHNLRQVLNEVDFYVPQFYEARVPRTLGRFATVSHPSRVLRGLRAARRTRAPFYVGLPAYGHAVLYDEKGRLLGPYRGLSIAEAARCPSFRLARAFPSNAEGQPATRATYVGEDLFDFIATAPASNGRGKGYHLVYDLPTSEVVSQHLELVRRHRPRNCRGVVLFRYPEPGETLTLPLPSLAAALKGQRAQPRLRVRLATASAPWELIETARDANRVPCSLTLTVTNVGAASTFLSPEAVTLTLYFNRRGLDDVEAGDFDCVETFYDDGTDLRVAKREEVSPGTWLRSGPRRANIVQFRRFYLSAGETARAGPLLVCADGATRVRCVWRVKAPGGFEVVHGEIEETKLSNGPGGR